MVLVQISVFYGLVRFRLRKTSCVGLQYLILSKETQLDTLRSQITRFVFPQNRLEILSSSPQKHLVWLPDTQTVVYHYVTENSGWHKLAVK